MTSTYFTAYIQQDLMGLSEEQLASQLEFADVISDNPSHLRWLIYAERSRRHALVCGESAEDCDYRPWDN